MTERSEPKSIRCNNCGHENLRSAKSCLVCDAPLTFTSRFQREQHIPTGLLPPEEEEYQTQIVQQAHTEQTYHTQADQVHTNDRHTSTPRKTGIKCEDCGHVNRVGDLFCIECGANILSSPIQESPSDITQEIDEFHLHKRALQRAEREAPIDARSPLDIAKPVLKSVDDTVIPDGCFQFTSQMRLRFTDIESGRYTEVSPKRDKPLLIGRSHQSLPIQPEVDLTPFLMEKHGVSRRHALIRLHDLRLEIQDLNSTNGTGINGFRFQAKETHQLRNSDILTLGRVSMKVTFLRQDKGRGSHVTDKLGE